MEKKSEKISYMLQFLDGARFIGSSLSNLVINLSGRTHTFKCKYEHDDKKYETYRIIVLTF